MKIVLADISKPMADAFKEFWNDIDLDGIEIVIHEGSIFDMPCNAIVSPANSFGFMGGGLDGILSKYLGWHVQRRVQDRIKKEFDGELLVGQSLIVPTDNVDFPLLISAPTMRVSMGLTGTANVYLASKAIFLALKKNPQITSVVIPGLGTGVGGIIPIDCARTMRMAFEDFYLEKYLFPETLSEACDYHDEQTKVETLNGKETL